MHRRPVYLYFLNVPSFSSRYFNKSRLGRLLALSLEILHAVFFDSFVQYRYFYYRQINPPIIISIILSPLSKIFTNYYHQKVLWV